LFLSPQDRGSAKPPAPTIRIYIVKKTNNFIFITQADDIRDHHRMA
jgi:hypothetical protein